jgi:uncharacterized protein YjbI with pentapeptide repeats
MADEERLQIIRQGVVAWNKWRKKHAESFRPELGRAFLDVTDLREANLREANLREANLREAKLGGADLSGAKLSAATLSEADLSGANLRGAQLILTDLRNATLLGSIPLERMRSPSQDKSLSWN